ncbi:hypothetical protein EDD22DRAFT_1019182 [Suillus occidentalis]|nr:hypothetical protein EDD22DRAFT_1019182 [Suillus occidentalis]
MHTYKGIFTHTRHTIVYRCRDIVRLPVLVIPRDDKMLELAAEDSELTQLPNPSPFSYDKYLPYLQYSPILGIPSTQKEVSNQSPENTKKRSGWEEVGKEGCVVQEQLCELAVLGSELEHFVIARYYQNGKSRYVSATVHNSPYGSASNS